MSDVTWLDALNRLKTGNMRFTADTPRGLQRDGTRRAELAAGQAPFAIVLSCADSRVVPELAFDAGLGELFVVRVAGNIPNPSSIASVELAVDQLGAKLIVVMAHEACGTTAPGLEHLNLEGHTISTLSKSDLFLHLCMHGAKHHWQRLDWICDLAELIRSGKEMDWCGIMEQSQTFASKRMTCLGMCLAQMLLGVDVPEKVQREVQIDKRVEPLAEQVHRRLFQQADPRNLVLEEITFYLRTLDRWRDKIRYCLDRLFNPPPWSMGSLSLPPSLHFLYYFLRPLQLLKQYGFRRR